MPRLILTLLVPIILLYPGVGQTDESGPSSYDECITQTMKGVASDVAARAIISSCQNMFPDSGAAALVEEEAIAEQQATAPGQEEAVVEQQAATPGTSRSLTSEELSRLRATAFILGTSYRLKFENENENLTITEVTIAVRDETDPDSLQEYRKEVRVPPLESRTTKYTVIYVGEDLNFDWKVASAKGID
jgi:hypothetical protein